VRRPHSAVGTTLIWAWMIGAFLAALVFVIVALGGGNIKEKGDCEMGQDMGNRVPPRFG
jgi:hypothetical protein